MIINAHSPSFNADGSITLTVLFTHLQDEVPFSASPNDSEPHGVELYNRALAEEFGPVAPYVAPPISVPTSVTSRQFKLALLQIDLLDDVETIIAASTDRAMQINWTEARDFDRNNIFVTQMAANLSKSEAEVDALFILAKTL